MFSEVYPTSELLRRLGWHLQFSMAHKMAFWMEEREWLQIWGRAF